MTRLLILALLLPACGAAPRGALELVTEHAFTQEGGDTFTYPLREAGVGWESRLRITLDIDLGVDSAVRSEILTVETTNPVDPPEPYTRAQTWTAEQDGRYVLLLPPDPEINGLSCTTASWDDSVVLCGEDGTLSEWRVVE